MKRFPACFLAWISMTACAAAIAAQPVLVQSPESVARETLFDALAAPMATRGATATITIAPADARRSLGPCTQMSGFMPAGARLVGRTVVGVRCLDGGATGSWQTFVGAEVRIDAPVWQVARALRVGDALAPGDVVFGTAALTPADLDAAAANGRSSGARGLATLDARQPAPFGRTVQRPVGIGHALAAADLREEGRVGAGESVRVVYVGAGFSVASEGRTVGAADPGASVQIRLASGAVINGTLRADRQVEIAH